MHLRECRESPFQEVLQRREAGEARRLAHHRQRGADHRLADHAIERGADVADQTDLAQASVEASAKYANERTQFDRKIGQFDAIRHMLADSAVELETARLLVYQAAWLRDQGRPHVKEASLAKWHASEAATKCANWAIQVHGGYGYLSEFHVERYWRDARICEIVRELFPLTPSGIIKHLDLRRPIFRKTAAGGHFGRNEPEFTWEKTDMAKKIAKAAEKDAVGA